MKKVYLGAIVVLIAVTFTYCHSAKKAAVTPPTPVVVKMTYETNIQPIIVSACAPCHFPAKGGNKEALDTYAGVSKEIDGILHRIQLNPDERGFMPMRHPKLSDSTIAVIKLWKETGMVEK